MPSTTKKAKPAKKSPLAITLLEKDHKTVDQLFKRYEKAKEAESAERMPILREICAALSTHAEIEEEIFYPALRDALKEDDLELLDEAHVEHASIKVLVAELEIADPDDDMVDAKVKVLSEYVKHHVKEEEDEIFPKARKAKSLDLEQIGNALQARKGELEAGGPRVSKGRPKARPAAQGRVSAGAATSEA